MTPPKRRLGITVTAAIVVANMIGTGVFTSAGFQAASLHDPMTILACWIVGGVLALCGAAAYAELGSMMPHAGGDYVYLREAYHPVVGVMSGWVSMTAGFSAPIAAASLAFSMYLSRMIPDLASHRREVAIGLILAITTLHVFDSKVGGWVQAVFTAVKVLLIVGFIFAGLAAGSGDWHNLASQAGGLNNIATTAFATSLMYVSFAYSGWNAAAYIANEVKRPERTLPRALLLGTCTVMTLYVLLNLVFLYATPVGTLAGGDGPPVVEVGDVAARSLFGASAANVASSVIALALVSSVSAMIMAGPRVYAAMAADHALPHQLAHTNKRGVPVIAVVAQGVFAALLVVFAELGFLLRLIGFTLTIVTALAVGAVFVFRARGHKAAYRTWGYPVTPVVFILLSIWIAYSQIKSQPKESAIGLGIIVGGLALCLAFVKRPATSALWNPARDLPEARVVADDDRMPPPPK
ncbi:MAG TPA: APC family permease [Polyangia bacterium]|nr:APC family permease [Polyangia bacterium]